MYRIATNREGYFTKQRLYELFIVYNHGTDELRNEVLKDGYMADIIKAVNGLNKKDTAKDNSFGLSGISQHNIQAQTYLVIIERQST